MASKINICSMACSLVGAKRVNDLDNPSTEEERECVLWWDHAVQEILEDHDWKFARDYQGNLAVSASPSGEYDHAYQIPNNCLVVRYLWDREALARVTASEYELHGRHILTDLDEVNVIFTRSDVAVGMFPAYFVTALVYNLAHYISYKLAEKGGKAAEMKGEYEKAKLKAIDMDQSQGNYPEDTTDPWLAAAGFSPYAEATT